MIHRVGTYFMLLGGLLLFLFVYSDIAGTPICGFLTFGVIFFLLGITLWFRDPVPHSQPTGRFRLFKPGEKKGDKKP